MFRGVVLACVFGAAAATLTFSIFDGLNCTGPALTQTYDMDACVAFQFGGTAATHDSLLACAAAGPPLAVLSCVYDNATTPANATFTRDPLIGDIDLAFGFAACGAGSVIGVTPNYCYAQLGTSWRMTDNTQTPNENTTGHVMVPTSASARVSCGWM
jgi:hypothetical protein